MPSERRRTSAPHARQNVLQINTRSRRTHCNAVKREMLGARKLIKLYEPRTQGKELLKADRLSLPPQRYLLSLPLRADSFVVAIAYPKTPEPIELSLPLLRESRNLWTKGVFRVRLDPAPFKHKSKRKVCLESLWILHLQTLIG